MATGNDKPRILVVEDESSIREGLCDVLSFRGYRVVAAADGTAGLAAARGQRFDLVILDIMLPGIDGFTLCETLRADGNEATLLMLTAKGSEDDVVRGFEAGADDYVTKPFSLKALLARVQAVLRRTRPGEPTQFSAGPLEIDSTRGVAIAAGEELELSSREVSLLRLLASDPGRIVSRRLLLREVWKMNNVDAVETRTVDVHIAKLRKKLGQNGAWLQTVRGQGYRWGAP